MPTPPAPTVTAPRPGEQRRPQPPPPPPPLHLLAARSGGVEAVKRRGVPGNASLHSSNDSGFSNEPPPQPEADYSDDEGPR
jgi:hypothetical protein